MKTTNEPDGDIWLIFFESIKLLKIESEEFYMRPQASLSKTSLISLISFATIFVAITTSCTRATSNISTTQIAIPQSLSQHMMNSTTSATDPTAGQILSHVVINVTALDMPTPIVSIWDSCNGCATANTPPATFDVSVPQGQNRLIQVIAVYQNSTTSAMSVYYGDVTQTLSSSVESAAITVTSVASGTVLNGRVMGRYFTSSTGGPTGRVNVLFDPGNGKQKMLVDHDRIVNGWFHIMVLSGIALTYQVPDTGDVLWGGPVSMESLIGSNPPSNSVAMAGVPVSLRQQNNNGVMSYNPNDAAMFVWGYFANSPATATAAAISSKAVCVDQTPGIQKLKVFTSTGVASGQPLLTVTAGAMPAATALANISSPMSTITMAGGVANGTGSCTSISPSALYTNDLPVSTMFIDGNGNDGAAGFRVPFTSMPGNFDFAITPPSNASTTISGQLLPGTTSVIDSVQVYKRVASDNLRIDSPDCNLISAGNLGYVLAGSASVPTPGAFSLPTNISASDKATGVSGVLCTSLAGKIYPAGVFIDSSLL